jgi:transcription initiation factor TFIIB
MKNETKKNKRNGINKKVLWSLFDEEINSNDCTKAADPLVCVYSEKISKDFCDQCSNILLFSEEGFLICTSKSCGIIYKDILDHSPEWRYYGADDSHGSDPTRCGMPINPLLKESSYGCKVLCNHKSKYEMRKIRRYTEWQSMPYKEKSQYDEFQIITIMANNAGIPKLIIDDAIRYHKKISEFDVTYRGDNRDGIIAASIYISCRINNFPRTAKEIANIFALDVTNATKGCKNAVSIINTIECGFENNEKTVLCRTKPEAFIQRYCTKLSINLELTKLCEFISVKIERDNLMQENTPHSIASGIIYFIAQEFGLNVNKREIKLVSEISEVTINKCFKKLVKMKGILIPHSLLKKYDIAT